MPEPPPTAFAHQTESRTTVTTTPATTIAQPIISEHSPAGDSAAETGSNDHASETVSPVSNPTSSAAAQDIKRPSGSDRLAGIVYGYGDQSPLNWSKSKLKSNAFGEGDKSTDADKENATLGHQAPQLTSSYVNTSYTSSFMPQPAVHSSRSTDYAPHQHTTFQHSRRYDLPPADFGESCCFILYKLLQTLQTESLLFWTAAIPLYILDHSWKLQAEHV